MKLKVLKNVKLCIQSLNLQGLVTVEFTNEIRTNGSGATIFDPSASILI